MSKNEREIKSRLQSYSRRLFIQRVSLLGGMIALGGGSYLYGREKGGPLTRSNWV